MPAVCAAALILVAALADAGRGTDLEPHLPKLQDVERLATPAGGAPDEPAQRLPPTVTICIDRSARRCWSAAGESDCRGDGAGGRVFRVVENRPDAGAGEALAACWADTGARQP